MIHQRPIATIIPMLALIFGCTLSASADLKFVPMLDSSLALNSAKYDAEYAITPVDENGDPIPTDQESTGENIYLYLAPNLGFTDIPALWITPVIEFEYTGSNNLLNLDDDAFVFNKRLNLYYLLGINYAFNPVWSTKLKGFGRLERMAETADETLNNGLYNYNDIGAWGEISARYRLGLIPMRTKLGYKGYTRRYPNYSNADLVNQYEEISGDTSTANAIPLMYEKDINVGEFWLRNEMTWGRLPVLTNAEIHFKGVYYTEMLKIQEDGTFSSDLRKDAYIDLYLEFPFLINKYHQLELDYAYRLRGSNQGYYDTNNSVFFDGYYNYNQNRFRLLYNFRFAFLITGFSPRGSVSLTWQQRNYYSRPSLQKSDNNDAVYKYDDPHWESNLDFGITLRQQLFAKWLNLFLSFHAITQKSNTNVEDAVSYNYKYNTFTLGTAVSF